MTSDPSLRVQIHLAIPTSDLGRLATWQLELEVAGCHCYNLKSLNVSYLATKAKNRGRFKSLVAGRKSLSVSAAYFSPDQIMYLVVDPLPNW